MLEVIPRRLTFISVIIPSREGVFTVACKGTHIPVCWKQTHPWEYAPVREILLTEGGSFSLSFTENGSYVWQ